ncbi:MAG: hypothetical protein Q9219_002063 [cf. Caloplaca sp. 3 TL-2023]
MSPQHIAILDCDPLIPSICAKYGSYGNVVTTFLQAGAASIGLLSDSFVFSSWRVDVELIYPDLEEIDAVVITGSRFNAYEDVEWINSLLQFLERAIETESRVKVIGLCFGHQIVGRALGAKGEVNSRGYEMSVCGIDLTEIGKTVFGKERLKIHQMHHDILSSYPPNVLPLGSSPVCDVQGIYVPQKILTLQGHPEFNEDIMTELLKASDEVGFSDDRAKEDALRRVGDEHDGTLVAAVMVRFIRGEM